MNDESKTERVQGRKIERSISDIGEDFQSGRPVGSAMLAVIVPTYNESANVAELVERLHRCLAGVSWEAIFVDDDSPDGTAEVVRGIAKEDCRIRCIRRIGRRGLTSACIEGMLATSADLIAVIDADMQHDEMLLPEMLSALQDESIDVVVGSRYVDGGGIGDWDGIRSKLSRLATRFTHFVTRANLTDPLSGFFMIRREVMQNAVYNLSGIGFKILMDLFASSPDPLRFRELPYEFHGRRLGESKLDSLVIWNFLVFLIDKGLGGLIPARFISFGIVGGLGVFVHLFCLTVLYRGLAIDFVVSQTIATLLAMTFNFSLNNILTYSDARLKGRQWLGGLFSFVLVCSVGALANVGIAAYLFQMNTGWVFSALAGILVGSVWNYAVTMHYTWHKG